MTREQIEDKAHELFDKHENVDQRDYPCLYTTEGISALIEMAEWAAVKIDPDAPKFEKIAGGYKITYSGIDYLAKGGFISVMAPKEVDGKSLVYDMQKVINRHSLENHSNTPDYALAAFLLQVLVAYGQAVKKRDEFHEAVMAPPFKSGGFVQGDANKGGKFIDEEGPECIITKLPGTPDLTDPDTLKKSF